MKNPKFVTVGNNTTAQRVKARAIQYMLESCGYQVKFQTSNASKQVQLVIGDKQA